MTWGFGGAVAGGHDDLVSLVCAGCRWCSLFTGHVRAMARAGSCWSLAECAVYGLVGAGLGELAL